MRSHRKSAKLENLNLKAIFVGSAAKTLENPVEIHFLKDGMDSFPTVHRGFGQPQARLVSCKNRSEIH